MACRSAEICYYETAARSQWMPGMPFLCPISDRYFEDHVEGDVHCFGTIAVGQMR
jgi:hypothetical protein